LGAASGSDREAERDAREALGGAFAALEPRTSIDYALRTLQQSQVQFSAMADAKANIMITVCSIVISASLTQLHRPELLRPLLTLDLFTVIALLSALLCVLPSNRVPTMRDGRPDLAASGFNPLFFMHFQHLSLDEFEQELASRFAQPGGVYRSLARDIYAAGVVLATWKYRVLRVSYLAFIAGLLAALAVALWESGVALN